VSTFRCAAGAARAQTTLTGLGLPNNFYVQIGLILLSALTVKNGILIIEVARERRIDAAIEASRTRFRPILMTSFAFILGVLPPVLATGAGANAADRWHQGLHRHARIRLAGHGFCFGLFRPAATTRRVARKEKAVRGRSSGNTAVNRAD
jgi:AcrB/AcrD/AcrF family